jgi:hypothetical protein
MTSGDAISSGGNLSPFLCPHASDGVAPVAIQYGDVLIVYIFYLTCSSAQAASGRCPDWYCNTDVIIIFLVTIELLLLPPLECVRQVGLYRVLNVF